MGATVRKPPDDDPKRLAREPEADAEIVRRLAEQNFDPRCRDWVELSGALIEYGYSVFVGWFLSGGAYQAAARQGRSGVRGLSRIPRDLKLQEDDAHDLTTTLIETAIPRFHQTLSDHRWQPGGGASLNTFFIGRCLMELPDVYERWHLQQDRWTREIVDLSDVDDGRFSSDPAEAAIATIFLDEVLPRDQYEHVRVMLEMSQSGYTMTEIADMFTRSGIFYSEAMVRTRISRTRSSVRLRLARGARGGSGE
jgi:hypothetical protein